MSDYDYEPDQNVVSLSSALSSGVVASLFLAIVFTILYIILTPGVKITINIYGDLYALCFILAFFAAFYALLLLVIKDDSNVIRIVSLVYAITILGVLITVVFIELNLGTFVNLLGGL